MSGATRGAAAIISRQYPAALYLHCSSHVLNLVVVKALDVTSVRNMMGTIERAATFFFAHPKRQKALERAIESTQPDTTKRKLKDLCRTRWVQRLEALDTFQQLLPSVVACMEAILEQGSSWSRDSLIDARGILSAITAVDFISALVICGSCLGYVAGLTKSLQAESKDIIAAAEEVSTVIKTVEHACASIDVLHSKWFSTVESLCEKVSAEVVLPRACGRQRH